MVRRPRPRSPHRSKQMEDAVTTTAAPTPAAVAAPRPAPKPKLPAKAKAPATKAKAKPKTKIAANGKLDRTAADVPVGDRRLALVKLMRKLRATSADAGVPISELAPKLGYTRYDVYCLAYHKYPLAAAGYVKHAAADSGRELCYYLTAKGAKAADDDVRTAK